LMVQNYNLQKRGAKYLHLFLFYIEKPKQIAIS